MASGLVVTMKITRQKDVRELILFRKNDKTP